MQTTLSENRRCHCKPQPCCLLPYFTAAPSQQSPIIGIPLVVSCVKDASNLYMYRWLSGWPVNCLVNPCQFASCPNVCGATCVADYCGGCHARWLLHGMEVTDQCQSTHTIHLAKETSGIIMVTLRTLVFLKSYTAAYRYPSGY